MKSYTDLEQSKRLSEILPLKSADMCYKCISEDPYDVTLRPYSEWREEYKGLLVAKEVDAIPCWSLAALYGILPNNEKESTTLSRGGWKIKPPEYIDNWWCEYEDDSHSKDFTVSADNPVDACVDMIVELHELKML